MLSRKKNPSKSPTNTMEVEYTQFPKKKPLHKEESIENVNAKRIESERFHYRDVLVVYSSLHKIFMIFPSLRGLASIPTQKKNTHKQPLHQ